MNILFSSPCIAAIIELLSFIAISSNNRSSVPLSSHYALKRKTLRGANVKIADKSICNTRNLEVDGCPSKENIFGQSALLMTAYIVFREGDLEIYGLIIACGINCYNSFIRLIELITQVVSDK